MAKDILFRKQALDSLVKGLDIAADAVGGTMGPNGRNVYFETDYGNEFTNDGATIANQIILEDKQQDAGAYIIRNVTGQTNDDAGDGTTTTAVLTQAIIHECLERPESPIIIKESLNEAGQLALEALAKLSKDIKPEDIERVAYISAEDTVIAKLLAEIIGKLGKDAVINVEDSKTFKTEYEIVDGYEAKVGFMSPYFINDPKSGKAIYENIPVLVTEKKIQNIGDIAPIFDEFKKQQLNQCVIVCEDIDDGMLGVFVQNKNMGLFNSLVIRATGDTLKDIEGVTGARRVSDSTGVTFKTLKFEDLGHAVKIVSDANKTLILGNGEASKKYAQLLDFQLQNEDNQYLHEILEQRIAKLRGGVATLRIAAPTDAERIYLRRKADDAVKATLAALDEGVVAGGGITLYRLAEQIKLSNYKGKSIGGQILARALTAPLRRIIENSGQDYTDIILNMPDNQGYNAKTNEYVNMEEAGILDPSKVTRCALENAISISGTFITTFCVITKSATKE